MKIHGGFIDLVLLSNESNPENNEVHTHHLVSNLAAALQKQCSEAIFCFFPEDCVEKLMGGSLKVDSCLAAAEPSYLLLVPSCSTSNCLYIYIYIFVID